MKNIVKKDITKRELHEKLELKRLVLKFIVYNQHLNKNIRIKASEILDALPKNSSFTRVKNFCTLTGRSKGVLREFQMSRILFKKLALKGFLPGVRKSSW